MREGVPYSGETVDQRRNLIAELAQIVKENPDLYPMAAAALGHASGDQLDYLDLDHINWEPLRDENRQGVYNYGRNDIALDEVTQINSMGELADFYEEDDPAGGRRGFPVDSLDTFVHENQHYFNDNIKRSTLARNLLDIPGDYETPWYVFWRMLREGDRDHADIHYSGSQRADRSSLEQATDRGLAHDYARRSGLDPSELPERHDSRVEQASSYLSRILGEK